MILRIVLTRERIRAMPFYHRPPADRGPLRPRSPMASGQAAATPTPAELAEAVGVGYAVIDLETTGLSPTTDSILEIALVLTDAAGRVERCWSTLIDPGAGVDVGPTHIHGLVAEELIGAPGLDDALAAAGLLRHYLGVGKQRGEEPVAWIGALVDAHRFTGWHWDAQRAQAGVELLTARTTPGAERARPEPESSGSRQ